jgi:hypothetical protein
MHYENQARMFENKTQSLLIIPDGEDHPQRLLELLLLLLALRPVPVLPLQHMICQ